MNRWTRREFNRIALVLGASFVASGEQRLTSQAMLGGSFVHPGMLHSAADLARMKRAIARQQQPIYGGFETLRADPHSQLNYIMRGPCAEAGRLPTVHIHEFDNDSAAAYQCALMWGVTDDVRYAAIARNILNAWAGSLKAITGVDAILACGLGGFLYLNAAEILRGTGQADDKEIAAWSRMFRQVFLPVIAEFAPFANGNWDGAALKTVMAIGVFCDDKALFDHAVQYYLYGCGNGRLTNYIYETGQCQESGRDLAHTQLGLGHMGDCCELAWQQGLDLYGMSDNRLLKGFEYTAGYQLGEMVPFTPDIDRTGKYRHSVIAPRLPRLQPIFEQIYNHYVHRVSMTAPQTERAAKKVRPEGADVADHPGFGTLAFSRTLEEEKERPPFGPGVFGLRVLGDPDLIKLEWLSSRGSSSYTVERATSAAGPFRKVASRQREPEWTDTNIASGRTYFYRVRHDGSDRASLIAGGSAGLPDGWERRGLGRTNGEAKASFNGEAYTLEAGGVRDHESFEGGIFVSRQWGTAGVFSARLLPRIASQQLSVGLMVSSADRLQRAAFYLSPEPVGVEEHPTWSVRLHLVGSNAPGVDGAPILRLETPIVSNGRILGSLWFRLVQGGKTLDAKISADGRTWQDVGTLQTAWVSGNSRVGFLLNSGLNEVTTEVIFDHVVVASLDNATR